MPTMEYDLMSLVFNGAGLNVLRIYPVGSQLPWKGKGKEKGEVPGERAGKTRESFGAESRGEKRIGKEIAGWKSDGERKSI